MWNESREPRVDRDDETHRLKKRAWTMIVVTAVWSGLFIFFLAWDLFTLHLTILVFLFGKAVDNVLQLWEYRVMDGVIALSLLTLAWRLDMNVYLAVLLCVAVFLGLWISEAYYTVEEFAVDHV